MDPRPQNSNHRALLGKDGERLARRFLAEKGYKILKTNYRSHLGEIDIVCQDGDTIVFVEVKSRASAAFGTPASAVTTVKQKKLHRLAQEYLIAHNYEDRPVRFDVLSIFFSSAGVDIDHLIGAF